MEVQQGDIVAVDFPFSDGTKTKRRPVLVLSGERINQTGDILLMQITSKFKDDDLTILLEDNNLTKPLPLKSFLRLHKIFALDKSLIVKHLSHLNEKRFREIVAELCNVLK